MHMAPTETSSITPHQMQCEGDAISSMIGVLTSIWQRVLQLPFVDIEANFLDLGGDSSLALRLFTEIAEVCGRELPPVVIYQAPTITALAALLEQPIAPSFPPLVLLKA